MASHSNVILRVVAESTPWPVVSHSNLLVTNHWPKGKGGSIPYRMARVYRTNMRVAHATERWRRIERTKKAFPNLEYRLGPSVKPCAVRSRSNRDKHAALAGTVLPVDHPLPRLLLRLTRSMTAAQVCAGPAPDPDRGSQNLHSMVMDSATMLAHRADLCCAQSQ